MAGVSAVQVTSENEMEMAIASYISQGFVLSNRSQAGATMFKKKEFQIVWAVIGFVLCLLPLLIYLIVYASQSDQMVQIQLVPAGAKAQLPAGSATQMVGTRSQDGHWWWDGTAWQPVGELTPSDQPTPTQPAAAAEWLPAPEPGAENPMEGGGTAPPQEGTTTPPA